MIGILIPAHNEEALLAHCLQAALTASQHPGLKGEEVKVLLVLDSCSDHSADIAACYDIHVLPINARNVGVARGVGAQWLLDHGVRWISCTDADSRVAPDWLVAQLALQADAVCGTVTVDDWGRPLIARPRSGIWPSIRRGKGIGIFMAPTWASVPGPTTGLAVLHRWPAMKMSISCSNWRHAVLQLPGAIARKS